MSRFDTTERIGVNAVERIVLKDLGWIFREQPIVDMGIDAHIERVDDGNPDGALLAVQIKTGRGNFYETTDALVYYAKSEHCDYWSGHSLPVLLIAHLPDTDETTWVLFNDKSASRTPKGFKIKIPKSNVFCRESGESISSILDGPPSQQRLRKLTVDQPLMRFIADGGRVSVELEEWINKSLRRTPVKIYVYDDDGNEILNQEWFQLYVGMDVKELTETLFPWAKVSIDEEFYAEFSELNSSFDEDWGAELSRAAAEDNGIYPDPIGPEVVYPYDIAAGEVDCYRLQLSLNALGRAFLDVSEFLADGTCRTNSE